MARSGWKLIILEGPADTSSTRTMACGLSWARSETSATVSHLLLSRRFRLTRSPDAAQVGVQAGLRISNIRDQGGFGVAQGMHRPPLLSITAHRQYGMGSSGYTGLKSIGNIPITVGSRTGHHPALISEEQHFDVVLGRSWLEKMVIKWVFASEICIEGALTTRVDPLDQTALTYMDTGEPIPCDLVVLKDSEGNVITVT